MATPSVSMWAASDSNASECARMPAMTSKVMNPTMSRNAAEASGSSVAAT